MCQGCLYKELNREDLPCCNCTDMSEWDCECSCCHCQCLDCDTECDTCDNCTCSKGEWTTGCERYTFE